MKFIDSTANPKLREINGLMTKTGLRKKSDLFVVEGQRELNRAIQSGFVVKELYWCPEVWGPSHFESWIEKTSTKAPVIRLSKKAYTKISYRSHSEGVIGLLFKKNFSLDTLEPIGDNPVILVVEHLEKPGNLGAILRTANAARVSCVLVAEPKTDIYNPNVIRSSVGGFFSVPIGVGSNAEVYEYLNEKNIHVYAACLQGATDYHKEDFSSPTAIVMGAEDTGLSTFWRERADKIIKIPMGGIVDSMNVSVASAILIYEVLRQRDFNH